MADEEYEGDIRYVAPGGVMKTGTWGGWYGENKGAMRASFWLDLGPMKGSVTFSLGTGYGKKPLDRWQLYQDDWEAIIKWADEECGRRIQTVPKSTGRPRKPRKGRKPCPKTVPMFMEET